MALHNIQYLCPEFATVLINTYRVPSRLFVVNGGEILSVEGTTQGDTLAMQFYGISITPVINFLRERVPNISQVWLADDATGAGTLNELLKWWKLVITEGEKYGYYVKPSKSWLIVKNPDHLQQAEELFHNSPIKKTTAGKRHLGAALGTEEFKTSYIDEKVNEWCMRLNKLTKIAKSQPHAAYAAYIHGEQHRYTYFTQTIPGIAENLEPLDKVLNELFIPTLFGREIRNEERELISIPIKDGGMGLRSININSDHVYETSTRTTKPLIDSIIAQSNTLPSEEEQKKARSDAIQRDNARKKQHTESTVNIQTSAVKRLVEQTSEPGASSWLAALPMSSKGFDLNKHEFQDALCIRYNLKLKNLPSQCPCGEPFDTTHALNCHKGGFVNARHDNVRDLEASFLKSTCNDVEIEPPLQPVLNPRNYQPSANISEGARLDVRARGFWRNGQNAFFDVKITNANAKSQRNKPLKTILRNSENAKKACYNQRVIDNEHGTFTPLIFTTTGVMGHECLKYHKALAERMCRKNGEKYEDTMQYIRMKTSFTVLRATLLCVRGSRSQKRSTIPEDDFSLSLNELGIKRN